MADEVVKPPKQKPTLFVALLVFALIAMAVQSYLIYSFMTAKHGKDDLAKIEEGQKKEASEAEQEGESVQTEGPTVPLESFIVNLAESKGRRIAKVSVEFQLTNREVQDEIERRKAEIRDMVLILLTSKTYQEISTKEGKDFLRVEIKDTVNAFLTSGKIERVLFTQFAYN